MSRFPTSTLLLTALGLVGIWLWRQRRLAGAVNALAGPTNDPGRTTLPENPLGEGMHAVPRDPAQLRLPGTPGINPGGGGVPRIPAPAVPPWLRKWVK